MPDADRKVIHIWVPGIPMPGGSKKSFAMGIKGTEIADPRYPVKKIFTKYRSIVTDANPKSKPWKQSVEWSAKESVRDLLQGPLELRIIFYLPRPKSHYGSGKNAGVLKASAPIFHTSKPDTTKLLRSTEDALKGIAWNDDCQVAVQNAVKLYSNRPGALISLGEAIPQSTEETKVAEEIIRRMGMRFL
jgi:Holliday junction resolvase RusA-like endonuclease